MARDPDTIERDIEKARDALAATLDELSQRANPQRVMQSAKGSAQSTLANPKVRYPLIGVGVLVVLFLIRKLLR